MSHRSQLFWPLKKHLTEEWKYITSPSPYAPNLPKNKFKVSDKKLSMITALKAMEKRNKGIVQQTLLNAGQCLTKLHLGYPC